MQIGVLMRKLAAMLGQNKPEALPSLKTAAQAMSDVLSMLSGEGQGPEAQPPEVPPPTPGEMPPPPSESAAPPTGYQPGM
jgi:hypothetical protein